MEGGRQKRKRKRRDHKGNTCCSVHDHSSRRGKVFFSSLLSPSPVQGMLQPAPWENKEECGIAGKKEGPTARSGPDPAHWLGEQSWCFYQGQDFASCFLALTRPQEGTVLWHQWDRNLPVATKCLCSYLIYFSKLPKQLNCSFARNWHKMRNFGLEFNLHRSERSCCLKFGYAAVFKAGMDGVSGGRLILLN